MNRIDLYKKTVDILYQAYFNDTLEHGNYCGCAVGNIIAANMGIALVKGHREVNWAGVDEDIAGSWYDQVRTYRSSEIGKVLIESTGYTIEEIFLIERAFEMCEGAKSKEWHMFNGLVAVLEALKEIHGITDESMIQASHTRFADHHKKLKTLVRN